jgi:predicted RNA binding protein YcfA (HicA-like mRNA interferase family)
VKPAAKHWKVTHPDGRAYTIPCHNGERTEVDKRYLRGLCKSLSITDADLEDL